MNDLSQLLKGFFVYLGSYYILNQFWQKKDSKMKRLDLLTNKLSKHFSIHPSRRKTLSSMILGLLCSRNVHQQSLACYVESTPPKAGLRRVERFFLKKLCPSKNMQGLWLNCLDSKESLICVLIGRTGSLAIRTSTTSS